MYELKDKYQYSQHRNVINTIINLFFKRNIQNHADMSFHIHNVVVQNATTMYAGEDMFCTRPFSFHTLRNVCFTQIIIICSE